MEIKIDTILIEHELLRVDSGLLFVQDLIVGFVVHDSKYRKCVMFKNELDEDIKSKLKPIIEKWVEDSKKVEKVKKETENKNLNEKLRSIFEL